MTVASLIAGLAVLACASPTIIGLVHALVPLVLVAGVVIALVRLLWFYTRGW